MKRPAGRRWLRPDAPASRCGVALLAVVSLAAARGATSARQPAGGGAAGIEVTIRPVTGDPGTIDGLEVTEAITGLPPGPSTPLVSLPLVVSNVETIASSVGVIPARDQLGPLRLAPRLVHSNSSDVRAWFPDRPVAGRVTLTYRAPIGRTTASRGAAPPLELRSEPGSLSGAGSTFLLLPPELRGRVSVHWDLGALPRGASGISSLGPGNVTLSSERSSRLSESFFMGGTVGYYAAGTFFGGWQGTPPFDARMLMAWSGRLHRHYLDFFRPPRAKPYGVFLRPNPVNAGGGVGLSGSFVATYGPATAAGELKLTVAHEMFHTFAPSIGSPAGLESSWFSEGLAVFYARTLALRFGQIGPDVFLRDLNFNAGRLYTSSMAGVPNSEVPARFWADTRVRTLPYDRGSFYFAVVNDKLRKASGDRRSLDDLLREMLARQRAGKTLSNSDWEQVLRADLGESAVLDFRAMLGGRVPVPPSDAFGPCFRRVTRPMRRYELGFEPAVLTERQRIVRGLVSGSEAERAGVRNGDEIIRPVPQDAIQGDQTRELELQVRRDGRDFGIRYLPRGETVQAFQWERVSGVPDNACRI